MDFQPTLTIREKPREFIPCTIPDIQPFPDESISMNPEGSYTVFLRFN